MGVWTRIKGIFRTVDSEPLNKIDVNPVDPRWTPAIPFVSRHAGVFIDPDTAMTFSAVFRAVSYISQSIAMLPWSVIRETDHRTIKLRSHPVWKLIQTQANPEMANYAWMETMVAWACSWGNAYSEIEFNKAGQPIALWPIEPYRVRPTRAQNPETGDFMTGPLVYKVNNMLGGQVTVPAANMFHLKGLGFNGLVGYSVISLAARSIGLSIASEQYAEDLFANGCVTTGALSHPGRLSKEAKEGLRQEMERVIRGHGRRFQIPVFEEGLKWDDMMINPEDAQLILTRKFQVNDIARWFGLPPHKLADLERATFTNIESQNIEVVQDALLPWVTRLEQEADIKLLSGRERGVRTKIDLRGFLRGDHSTRATYYRIMRNIGVYSTNEIRRLEDMDPVGPEGDALTMQSGFVTLKSIVDGPPTPPPAPQKKDGKQPAPGNTLTVRNASLGYFREAEIRIYRREVGQFNQQRPKLENNPSLFDQWEQLFSQKNRHYIAEQFTPLAWNFMGLLRDDISRDDPDASNHINEAINAFIHGHRELSNAYLRAAFEDDSDAVFSETSFRMASSELLEKLVALAEGLPQHPKRAPSPPREIVTQPVVADGWSEIGVYPNAC